MAHIEFDPATHTYRIGNKQLISVSAVIAELTPVFDRERVSESVAAKRGIKKAELLMEWSKAGEIARDRGELVHAYIDDILNDNGGNGLFSFSPGLPECKAFDAAWDFLKSKLSASVLAKEQIIGDEELGIAGRYDLLLHVYNQDTVSKIARLFDWKTGKYKIDNRFENMLPPFDDLPNCEHTRVSMQTSLYRIMLERSEYTHALGDPQIVHLMPSGEYVIYRAIDLRERLEKWLIGRN